MKDRTNLKFNDDRDGASARLYSLATHWRRKEGQCLEEDTCRKSQPAKPGFNGSPISVINNNIINVIT